MTIYIYYAEILNTHALKSRKWRCLSISILELDRIALRRVSPISIRSEVGRRAVPPLQRCGRRQGTLDTLVLQLGKFNIINYILAGWVIQRGIDLIRSRNSWISRFDLLLSRTGYEFIYTQISSSLLIFDKPICTKLKVTSIKFIFSDFFFNKIYFRFFHFNFSSFFRTILFASRSSPKYLNRCSLNQDPYQAVL